MIAVIETAMTQMTDLGSERGGLFGFALILALIASIAAYAALFTATAGGRYGKALKDRPRARYAAEAGIVIAREQLQRVPTYCGSPVAIDTDADGTNDTTVDITVTACGAGNENQPHIIRGRVLY